VKDELLEGTLESKMVPKASPPSAKPKSKPTPKAAVVKTESRVSGMSNGAGGAAGAGAAGGTGLSAEEKKLEQESRKVFIGGLPSDCTKEDLRKFGE